MHRSLFKFIGDKDMILPEVLEGKSSERFVSML
jgi:hypothetical protein